MSYYSSNPNTPLHYNFLAPLKGAVSSAKSYRECTSLPDEEWIEAGVRRILSNEKSGCGFLHLLADQHDRVIQKSLYFASLKSKRRLSFAREVNGLVHDYIQHEVTGLDPFADIASLTGYDIYAGDGHYIEHACHDNRIDDKQFATGSFFGLDLRTHAMHHLALGERGGTRKREHDMRALKRLDSESLRRGAPSGHKVIWVWDRAGIDAAYWQKMKQQHGVYFISRAKENMTLTKLGELEYDHEDPLNSGVTAFHLVEVASQALRCIYYTCPITGVEYTFLTSLTCIEPGVIAALYKARWDIEKVFEETKRKLGEAKSWAASNTDKCIHAALICLTHNLLLFLERSIERDHDISNKRESKRREKRKAAAQKLAKACRRKISPLIDRLWDRASQRTVIFIRWLKNNLDSHRPLQDLLARLARRCE